MVDEEFGLVMVKQTLLGNEIHEFDVIIAHSHHNHILFEVLSISLRESNDEAIFRMSDGEFKHLSHGLVLVNVSCPE
jgi:hypothetical protein